MGTEYLLDTNVIIDFAGKKLPFKSHLELINIINDSSKISIINKIELLSIPEVSNRIQFFTEEAYIFPLSDDIVIKTIEIRKKRKIKLPDAIIAATAIVFNLTLITHNVSDFQNIKNLKV